ncbi:hypothetical protein BDV32DRAFT_131841 [Aspergillus pseudonomiae]|nr:hypothetical protein BDV32DRAFT_131841 [Aspergillus pseudonomiae]
MKKRGTATIPQDANPERGIQGTDNDVDTTNHSGEDARGTPAAKNCTIDFTADHRMRMFTFQASPRMPIKCNVIAYPSVVKETPQHLSIPRTRP